MSACPVCGGELDRANRTAWERLWYRAVYRCRFCGEAAKVRWPSPRYRHCPSCGTHKLKRMNRVDRIDRLHRGLLSSVQKMLGAPLYWCPYCRLQFWDYRPLPDE